ncbi:fibronectin type III domain-containing protein [Aeromicrobium sp. 9AM]|uniref:fibronectin type III domain-containing protein n=1 Tax=Aeromicrobium sp. 9AM TaxID=2653126 RepID=UPI0012F0F021|nr:fibronectin type III domain-containing protein [Aeromicrobium sp. 9AM]VXB03960.1 hypothetical protein AERO9AM_10261 [Aeromicrobium sp. 9AM]
MAEQASAAEPDTGTIISNGKISTDTTWTAAGSPYRLETTVQVDAGVALTLEPGTVVISPWATDGFLVAGTLDVGGSREAPVELRGSAGYFARVASAAARIDVNHAKITGFGSLFYSPSANATYSLQNSNIQDISSSSSVRQPKAFTAKNNAFDQFGGFTFTYTSTSTPSSAAIIDGNRFRGRTSASAVLIKSTDTLGNRVQVHGNTFERTLGKVIDSAGTSPVDATGNYWFTTNSAEILDEINDSRNQIGRTTIVPVEPVLDDIPAGTPALRPNAPWGVIAIGTTRSISALWSPPATDGGSPVLGYSLTLREPLNDTIRTAEVGPGATTYTFTGLRDQFPYTVTVRAINAVGASDVIIRDVNTTNATLVPGAVTAEHLGDGDVNVNWIPSHVNGVTVTEYKVFAGNQHLATVGADQDSVTVPVPLGGRYEFGVIAVTNIGDSSTGWSKPLAVDVPPSAPIAKAVVGDRRANLSWVQPANSSAFDVTSYVVKNITTGTEQLASSTTAQVTGLTPGKRYQFVVVARSDAGQSAPSATVSVLAATKPGAVAKPRVTAGKGKVTISWRAPATNYSPIKRYEIWSSTGSVRKISASARTYTWKSLKKGKKVKFRVRAVNSVGTGSYSTTSSTVTVK